MELTVLNIVQVIVIWQSLLLGVILITPKYTKRRSNIFLAALLFVVSIHFTYNVLLTQNILVDQLSRFSCSYGFLYGPLAYFYVKVHLIKSFSFKRNDWLHFVPFFVVFTGALFHFVNCGPKLALLLIVTVLFYCILGFWEIFMYQRAIKFTTTQLAIPEVKWLQLLLIVMLVVILLDLIDALFPVIDLFGVMITMETIVQIGILIIVNLITFQGLKNPQFFQQLALRDIHFSKEITMAKRKDSQHNTFEVNKEHIEQINTYMDKYKPYLDPDLNLSSLAISLEMHKKTLSQIINQHFKVNFSEYINGLRIMEAKELLKTNRENKLSIKEIMYGCGFNSRSVFNTFFKKKVGVTPSEFLSRYKNRTNLF